MNIKILPKYSSERYFLISEIENKTKLFFVDKVETNLETTKINEESDMTILYCLYEFTQSKAELIQKIKTMLEVYQQQLLKQTTKPYLGQTAIALCMDIHIPSKDTWTENTQIQQQIQDFINTFTGFAVEKLCIHYVAIGLTDHKLPVPGLETCFDIIEKVLPGFVEQPKLFHFVLYDRMEMLGHDPMYDHPDAVDNIFQVVCFSDLYSEEKFYQQIHTNMLTRKTSSSNSSSASGSDSKTTTTTTKTTLNTKNKEGSYWFWILLLIACIVIYKILYYYASVLYDNTCF